MTVSLSYALVYQVVCLLLVPLVHPGALEHCQRDVECRGERPLLPTGCCPVEAGQECQPSNGTSCDVELGFSCVNTSGDIVENGTGICRGRYGLQVISSDVREISLNWTSFAPPGYMFEYVLLYRNASSQSNLSEWRRREIGNQPRYTVQRLSPATLYFLKVAIWEDAYNAILGNTSETIIVETSPVKSCQYGGRTYPVGERFIHECEDNCTCLPTGQIQCVQLCPELPELEEGCRLISGQQCCEYKIICPSMEVSCSYHGSSYSHGEEFQSGCRDCICNNGSVECTYPSDCYVMEPTDDCPDPRSREVEGQCCPEWDCGDECFYENQTYIQMEYFTSSNCSLCQCHSQGVVQCSPDCPPVEMVLPDASCPDPHIRHNGCCDTLYCHDPSLDVAQQIRRMFALSYSSVSLTLSFEVDPQTEVNGIPQYCQYEILYANTSDPFVTWTHRLIQPVDVRLHSDQPILLEPTEALTRDNAIVVGNRAYITLSGMYPNTTYYVKIIPIGLFSNDMPGYSTSSFNYSDTRISAMVVVKTMSLANLSSCFHNGTKVLHGELVSSHCSRVCRCMLGKVTCESTCEEEQFLVARSLTCPQPQLVKRDGDCCPTWSCQPEATGCGYGGIIMESGQSLVEECQVCTCMNSSIRCRSVCPPPGTPPRPGCQLTNLTGDCCLQWKCPVESHLPHGIKSSVSKQFNSSSCHKIDSQFVEEFRSKLVRYLIGHMDCSNIESRLAAFCDTLQVDVQCPNSNDVVNDSNERQMGREVDRISVIASLYLNFSSTSDALTVKQVQFAGMQLLSVMNTSFEIMMDQGLTLTSNTGAQFQGVMFVCNPGFTFTGEYCVLTKTESRFALNPDIKVAVLQLTADSAVLEWSAVGSQDLDHITGFQVELQEGGSSQWSTSSNILDPSVTSHKLNSLAFNHNYTARLVAFTAWPGYRKRVVGEVRFTTKPGSSLSAAVSFTPALTLAEVSVSETCALFYWDLVSQQPDVAVVNVTYRKTHEQHSQGRRVSLLGKTHVQLVNLEPATSYTAELLMQLPSNQTLMSFPVYFVTTASRKDSEDLLTAVIVSCSLTVVASLVVSLSCFLWRRSRNKGGNNGFENKIFGIQLENNNDRTQTTPTRTAPTPHPASD